MKKLPSKVDHNQPNFFPVLPWAAHMAKNWKFISEIELRHPLLYLLCSVHCLEILRYVALCELKKNEWINFESKTFQDMQVHNKITIPV